MATWHQQQRPVRLWHETQWTVVIDPPNSPRGVARFDTRADAETYLANVKARGERHAYILNPEAA